ncbi:hypothetical protein ACOME3_006857 [Neoechinorhynchus agilis]
MRETPIGTTSSTRSVPTDAMSKVSNHAPDSLVETANFFSKVVNLLPSESRSRNHSHHNSGSISCRPGVTVERTDTAFSRYIARLMFCRKNVPDLGSPVIRLNRLTRSCATVPNDPSASTPSLD